MSTAAVMSATESSPLSIPVNPFHDGPDPEAVVGELARLAGIDPAAATAVLREVLPQLAGASHGELAQAVLAALGGPALQALSHSHSGRELLEALGHRPEAGGAPEGAGGALAAFGAERFRMVRQAPGSAEAPKRAEDGDAIRQAFKEEFGAKAADPEGFHALMKQVYGEGYDRGQAEQLRQRALAGDWGWLPKVQLVGPETLHGAHGAYDAQKGVVYIDRELAARDPATAAQTFVEEAGHHLDAKLNRSDSRGDEGELFRRLLGGEKLDAAQVEAIRAENDHGTIVVDGKTVEVEFWNPFEAIGDAAKAVGGAIVDGAKAVGGAIADGAEAVAGAVGDVAGGVWNGVKDVGEGVFGAVGQFGKGVFEMTGGFLVNLFEGNIGEALDSVVRGIDRAVLQAPQRLLSGVLDGVKSVFDGVTDALGPIGEPLRWVTDRVFDIVDTGVDTVFGMFRDAFRLVPELFTGFVGDVERAVKLAADGDWGGAAEQLGKAVLNVPGRIVGTVVDIGARALQGAASIAQTAVGAEPPARGLTAEERQYLEAIYGDSIDYDMLRVKPGGALNDEMAAHVVGNTVYMPTFNNAGVRLVNDDGTLTPDGLETLGHEAGHVWQNQNGGGDYIHDALGAQAWASITGSDRNGAYDWRQALRDGATFETMNDEQRAQAMEDIGTAISDADRMILADDGVKTQPDGSMGQPYSDAELAFLRETWDKLKFGQGAG